MQDHIRKRPTVVVSELCSQKLSGIHFKVQNIIATVAVAVNKQATIVSVVATPLLFTNQQTQHVANLLTFRSLNG